MIFHLFFVSEPDRISFFWSQDNKNFGQLELLEVNIQEISNQLTQIKCLCGIDCSGMLKFKKKTALNFDLTLRLIFLEPLFIRANIIVNEEEYLLYHVYQPSGALPPLVGEGCQSFVDTYGLLFFFS